MVDTGRRIYEKIYAIRRIEGKTIAAAAVTVALTLTVEEIERLLEMANMVTTDRFLS